MKEKQWGIVLIIVGIFITIVSIIVKLYRDVLNECDGCSYMIYTIIWFIAGFIIVIGFLLFRSDELDNMISESKLKLNKEFEEIKNKEREKENFQKFLMDFNKSEKEVIEILHTYEGISQNVLEKKVSYSNDILKKSLKSLEKREIITIMDSKKIYLLRLSK